MFRIDRGVLTLSRCSSSIKFSALSSILISLSVPASSSARFYRVLAFIDVLECSGPSIIMMFVFPPVCSSLIKCSDIVECSGFIECSLFFEFIHVFASVGSHLGARVISERHRGLRLYRGLQDLERCACCSECRRGLRVFAIIEAFATHQRVYLKPLSLIA